MKLKIGLGKLRLLLALLVVNSHISVGYFLSLGWDPGTIGNYNSGVVAVVIFFAISGFVMSALWKEHYEGSREVNRVRLIKVFYLDRLIRLFPQFILYFVVTLLCIQLLNFESPFWQSIDFVVLVQNLTILPSGFYMFLKPHSLFVPQAWSLGLELTFYAVVPFLLKKWNWRKIYFFAYTSISFFLLPFFGLINSDWYGYRLLPGVIFIFIIGVSSKDFSIKRKQTYLISCRLFLGLLLTYSYTRSDLYELKFNKEVLLGALIATFLIPNISTNSSKWDTWCGDLSYGVFLNHILIATLINNYFPSYSARIIGVVCLVAIAAVSSGFSYYFVERRALVLRRRLRMSLRETL
jgi:peptidoglycan/LPS O-acetylase OafA/YrhL